MILLQTIAAQETNYWPLFLLIIGGALVASITPKSQKK